MGLKMRFLTLRVSREENGENGNDARHLVFSETFKVKFNRCLNRPPHKPVSQSCAEHTSRCFGGPHVL